MDGNTINVSHEPQWASGNSSGGSSAREKTPVMTPVRKGLLFSVEIPQVAHQPGVFEKTPVREKTPLAENEQINQTTCHALTRASPKRDIDRVKGIPRHAALEHNKSFFLRMWQKILAVGIEPTIFCV